MSFVDWLGDAAADFKEVDEDGSLDNGFQPVAGAEDMLDIWNDLKAEYESSQHNENLRPSEESHIL